MTTLSFKIILLLTFFTLIPLVDVDPDLDQESQDYLEALAQATGDLEFCVNLCKSRVMMETCFDIAVPAIPGQSGQQEMEV